MRGEESIFHREPVFVPAQSGGFERNTSSLRGYRAATIGCGTSQGLFLLAEDLPPHGIEDALLALLIGKNAGGEDHYQNNKVGVVGAENGAHTFSFRFFQADKSRDWMLGAPECANVAAGCGAFALLSGVAVPDPQGWLYGFNAATQQKVLLRIPGNAPYVKGDWNVLFVQDGFSFGRVALTPFFLPLSGNASVECLLIDRGNLFVFANLHPTLADEQNLQELAETGTKIAQDSGVEASRARAPKIILYGINGLEQQEAWLDIACFFQGEMHKSLPGSGAMTLAGYLALSYLSEHRSRSVEGVFRFHMCHPSNIFTVSAHWQLDPDGYRISATEFSTPIRLIMSGELFANESQRTST